MPKHQFKIGIKNVVVKDTSESSVVEIHILDTIYETGGWDWWSGEKIPGTVETIIDKVKAANATTIKVIIDSEGGDAGLGLAIYNFLKAYNATVKVEVIGMAGSIASVIACAADKGELKMARNSFMVIHRAWGGGWGNSEDLRAAADVIDKYTEQIVDVYVQRTGLTAEKVNGLIANGDHWMTGTEAKDLGFCDEVINNNDQFQIAARIGSLDEHYKNVPQNLTQPTPQGSPILNFLKDEIMNIKNLVSNFIDGTKKGAPTVNTPQNQAEKPEGTKSEGEGEPKATTLVDVANALEKPLTDFLTEVETEVRNEVSTAISESETIKKLEENVNNLLQQVKNLTGKESTSNKDDEGTDGPIGSFS